MTRTATFYAFSKLSRTAFPISRVAGSIKKTLLVFFSTALWSAISATSLAAVPPIRITEYMYNGLEFIEFTNIGTVPVDMTGWSFDDDNPVPGTVSLSAFGIVQPGESVILSESPAATFREQWNLCAQVKIIGDNSANLGRNDEINLYDAENNLVDRLIYGDQNFPGTVRTHEHSAWVRADGLGMNDISKWTLSSSGDAEGSFASTGGQYGSPGKSTRATVTFDPCAVTEAAPVIVIDVTGTSNFLDGGASVSPASPYSISGVINDETDPARYEGIHFTISDNDTPVENLTIAVATSNAAVVPQSGLNLTGSGASRHLTITPALLAGYSNITVSASDGTHTTLYVLSYAASYAAPGAATRWHTGASDASTAIALDNDYMIVSDNQVNFLYVYDRHQSGLPVAAYDFNQGNILDLTDPVSAPFAETDIETGVKSAAQPGRIYFFGSMSNSASANTKPNRDRVFAVTVTGTGAGTAFSNAGYARLRSHLTSWGDSHGYDLSASAADGKDPRAIDGFNVEGAVFAPDNTTLYIGFRAPLVPTGARTKALLAPVLNFESWFNDGAPAGSPVIGAPIELDLGLRGIREIVRLSNGKYIILAGNYGGSGPGGAVYGWSGNAGEPAVLIPSFDISQLNAEGVMEVAATENTSDQRNMRTADFATDKLQVISDNGSSVYYNDGIDAQDLSQKNFRKFASDIITGVDDALPVTLVSFGAARNEHAVDISWQTADYEDGTVFEILRSFNGHHFEAIHRIPAVSGQYRFSFRDEDPATFRQKTYYRLGISAADGKTEFSIIRSVEAVRSGEVISLYPNPSLRGALNIKTIGKGMVSLKVYNNLGIRHHSVEFKESTSLDTANWPSGTYLLHFTTLDGQQFRKTLIVIN